MTLNNFSYQSVSDKLSICMQQGLVMGLHSNLEINSERVKLYKINITSERGWREINKGSF